MKRLLGVLLALGCLFGAALPGAAAGPTYTLEELYLQVSLPEGFFAFTRDIDPADPHLNQFEDERAKDTLEAYYQESGIYLDAYAEDGSCEILISMSEDSGTRRNFDFNRYSDEELLGFGQEIRDGAYEGITYTCHELHAHAQAKFLLLDFRLTEGDTTRYGRQYYTIINGQEISFSLYSLSGPITAPMTKALQQTLSGAFFTVVLDEPEGNAKFWLVAAIVVIGMVLLFLVCFKALRNRRRLRALQNAADSAPLPPDASSSGGGEPPSPIDSPPYL